MLQQSSGSACGAGCREESCCNRAQAEPVVLTMVTSHAATRLMLSLWC